MMKDMSPDSLRELLVQKFLLHAQRSARRVTDACGLVGVIADDIVNDAVNCALEKTVNRGAAYFSTESHLRAHFCVVARHTAYDLVRKAYRRKTTSLPEELTASTKEPLETLADDEMLAMLPVAMNALTEKQRRVVRLRMLDELTWEEIGRQMGINKGSASGHYQRALKTLRRYMRQHYGEGETE